MFLIDPFSDQCCSHSTTRWCDQGKCNVSYHFFADDSQLQGSAQPILVPRLVQEITLCTEKTSDWMTANKLKMNDDKTVSKLIRWCSEPSQTKRIISGLKTNFNLSPSHSLHKSSYHKSLFPKPQLRLYPQFRNASPENNNNNTCSGAYLYSAGTQHGNLHSAS